MKRNRKIQRGVASVEAVIMLPVLVLMLFGVGYVSRLFSQTLTANDRARLCVQRFAQMSCEHQNALPTYCRNVFRNADEPPPEDSESQAALSDAREDDGVQEAQSRSSMLTDILDGLFGDGKIATAKMGAKRPRIFGGGETPIRAGSYALCNTKPVVADDLASALFGAFYNKERKQHD